MGTTSQPTPCISFRVEGGFLALAGFHLRRVLSAEIFAQSAALGQREPAAAVLAGACQERWTDLANGLAALPRPAEIFLIVGREPEEVTDRERTRIAFLVAGRGKSAKSAEEQCRQACADVWRIAVTTLDYADLRLIQDPEAIRNLAHHLQQPRVLEFRRRLEALQVTHGAVRRSVVGFEGLGSVREPSGSDATPSPSLTHLFPWVPSNDPWRRLLETLDGESDGAAFVVHATGLDHAPPEARAEALGMVAGWEHLLATEAGAFPGIKAFLRQQVELLRHEALMRVAVLEKRLLAARVFLTAAQAPSDALVAVLLGSIDDASVARSQFGADAVFRGGARTCAVDAAEVLAPLVRPGLVDLFGVEEVGAILRTPMPGEENLPGVPMNRARTARISGVSGRDVPIGQNVHRGSTIGVCLDSPMRLRHAYVIGQTGTGKSTVLFNMIMDDIRRGRGVGVLDPHGSLVDDILNHYPEERAHDLVVVDPTDAERPVGINMLYVREPDPLRYRLARDLIIDDLYCYLDMVYDMRATGGPMFESYYRSMLALMMGIEEPAPDLVPSLMLFRAMFDNEGLRTRLLDRMGDQDPVVTDFVREIQRTSGEAGLSNMSPYVTSKINRFITDVAMRNICCQNRILDFEAILNTNKVLLVNLGRGQFGDKPAGLLASQIVSRLRLAAMKRGAHSDAPPFYLYADEFQLFADNRFAEILAEARKFGLGLTLAHQYAAQLPAQVFAAVTGNVGTVMALRVGASDARLMAPLFQPTFGERDLMSLPNFSAYVRSFGCLGETPFSTVGMGPQKGGDRAKSVQLRELARQRYGRARDVVEREIVGTYQRFTKGDDL